MKNIVIIPNEHKDAGLKCAKEVAHKVIECKKTVCFPESFREFVSDIEEIKFLPDDRLFENADLALVPGGDGSIIHTAREAALREVPIVGINLGRLGYLAELELDDTDMLKDIFDGKYTLSKRMMLSYEIVKADKSVTKGAPALNDIVLTSQGNTNRVVDIEIYAGENEAHAGSFKGNGVIASTPTGSTAYALAAGGPVIDPALECINIVPLCTHSLMARPMIFSATDTLKLVNSGRVTINVSADGSEEYPIEPGEYVVIKKADYAAHFLRVRNSSFYEVLRKKMADK